MAEFKLKSYEFRREREATWRELERLIAKAERGGLKSLTADELLQLPAHYRATLSSLSTARAISLDRSLLTFLENLAARSYFVVYGVRAGFISGVAAFFARRFPAAVRAARWHILAAFAFLVLGGVTGFALTIANSDWFYTFVPGGLAGGRSPAATTEMLYDVLYDSGGSAEALSNFATFLFTNNAAVGILAFALGFAFGIPTILLLFYNGLILGAFAALYHSRGLSLDLWAWLSIHGTTEILAIVLCGAGGLVLGASVAFPGRHSRLENLSLNGRQAGEIIIGTVFLFLAAGLLEGFGRQLITGISDRYLIAAAALTAWAVYFIYSGRRRGAEDDGDR